MDPIYGYEAVNVEAQAADPHSLLNWTRRVLAVGGSTGRSAAARFRLLYRGTARCSPICANTRPKRCCASPIWRARPGGGTRSVGVHRPRAGGTRRRLGVSAGRTAHLPAYAAAVRFLLVPSRPGSAVAVHPHTSTGAHARILDHRRAPSLHKALATARGTAEREILPAYLTKRRRSSFKDQTFRRCVSRCLAGALCRTATCCGRDRDADCRWHRTLAAAAVGGLGGEPGAAAVAACPCTGAARRRVD